MSNTLANSRLELLAGLQRFVVAAREVAGVRRIALVDPKDIDVLVAVADAQTWRGSPRMRGGCRAMLKASIEAPMCFSRMSEATTSAGSADGRTAGLASDGPVTHGIAGGGRTSMTISTR
jgi:hypothetical protein